MRKILISINPEYVDLILKKIKRFEYRKRVAKKDIKSIVVYCTYPTKKVVAEVEIKNILDETPERLWEITKAASGVDKAFYDMYFLGCTRAYAYELGNIKLFKKPRTLKDFNLLFAPQSFVYV